MTRTGCGSERHADCAERRSSATGNQTLRGLLATTLLLTQMIVSCSDGKVRLPKADSLLVEPAGMTIDSPMQTMEVAAFIEELPGIWKQPLTSPQSAGTTLLFKTGGDITSTVRLAGNSICVSSGTSNIFLENALSNADREKLETLLGRQILSTPLRTKP